MWLLRLGAKEMRDQIRARFAGKFDAALCSALYAYRLARASAFWCGRLLSVAASRLEPTIKALHGCIVFPLLA